MATEQLPPALHGKVPTVLTIAHQHKAEDSHSLLTGLDKLSVHYCIFPAQRDRDTVDVDEWLVNIGVTSVKWSETQFQWDAGVTVSLFVCK